MKRKNDIKDIDLNNKLWTKWKIEIESTIIWIEPFQEWAKNENEVLETIFIKEAA